MKPQILRDLRFLFSLVVACGPADVPGAGGPGRCVCRWAAARPRAVRAASFARRVASKPGQAPPPPTGTAADPSGALHTSGTWCADVCLCFASKPGQVPPPPINFARNSPAACSIIEFASLELQCFWGVSKNDHDKLRAKFGRRRRLVADMWLGASPRSLARPRASKRSLSSVSHAIP